MSVLPSHTSETDNFRIAKPTEVLMLHSADQTSGTMRCNNNDQSIPLVGLAASQMMQTLSAVLEQEYCCANHNLAWRSFEHPRCSGQTPGSVQALHSIKVDLQGLQRSQWSQEMKFVASKVSGTQRAMPALLEPSILPKQDRFQGLPNLKCSAPWHNWLPVAQQSLPQWMIWDQ